MITNSLEYNTIKNFYDILSRKNKERDNNPNLFNLEDETIYKTTFEEAEKKYNSYLNEFKNKKDKETFLKSIGINSGSLEESDYYLEKIRKDFSKIIGGIEGDLQAYFGRKEENNTLLIPESVETTLKYLKNELNQFDNKRINKDTIDFFSDLKKEYETIYGHSNIDISELKEKLEKGEINFPRNFSLEKKKNITNILLGQMEIAKENIKKMSNNESQLTDEELEAKANKSFLLFLDSAKENLEKEKRNELYYIKDEKKENDLNYCLIDIYEFENKAETEEEKIVRAKKIIEKEIYGNICKNNFEIDETFDFDFDITHLNLSTEKQIELFNFFSEKVKDAYKTSNNPNKLNLNFFSTDFEFIKSCDEDGFNIYEFYQNKNAKSQTEDYKIYRMTEKIVTNIQNEVENITGTENKYVVNIFDYKNDFEYSKDFDENICELKYEELESKLSEQFCETILLNDSINLINKNHGARYTSDDLRKIMIPRENESINNEQENENELSSPNNEKVTRKIINNEKNEKPKEKGKFVKYISKKLSTGFQKAEPFIGSMIGTTILAGIGSVLGVGMVPLVGVYVASTLVANSNRKAKMYESMVKNQIETLKSSPKPEEKRQKQKFEYSR